MQFIFAVQSGVVCGHLGFSWLYLLVLRGAMFQRLTWVFRSDEEGEREGAPNLELNSVTLWVEPWELGWA